MALDAGTRTENHDISLNYSDCGAALIDKAAGMTNEDLEQIREIDPSAIVHQLKGISGPNPVWDNGELILGTAGDRTANVSTCRRDAPSNSDVWP